MTDFGEFTRHQWLRQVIDRCPLDPIGIGDDCCVLNILPEDYLLISSDRVPLSAYRRSIAYVGALCAVHNLSDIICKGGRPIGMLIDTFLPKDMQGEAWKELVLAAQDCCRRYGAYILGGDTKEAPTMSVVGCAVGMVKKNKLLLRSGASPGDVCALTLTGGVKIGIPWAYHVVSSLQIQISEQQKEWMEREFVDRNLTLPYNETLAANEVEGAITASIDASDGIGGALHLLCRSSGVGVQLDYDSLCAVVHEEAKKLADALAVDPVAFAFSPGFTWENVFAVRPSSLRHVQHLVSGSGGQLIILGRFVAESGAWIKMRQGEKKKLALYYNESFRDERYLSNSIEDWRAHRFFD